MHVTEPLLNGVILAGIAGYALAWLLLLLRRRRAGELLLAAAWLATIGVFLLNWRQAGEPPFGNMYHVQVVLALCFPPLFLFLAARREMRWTGVYFAFVSLLPMLGALCMDKDLHWRRMPALQSPWFVPHVTAYMIGYALAAVAFAMAAAKWLRVLPSSRERFAEPSRRQMEIAPAYGRAVREIIRISFPFMTFGLLSGALWAEEAWGAYWSWDPKETWALITWTLYLIYLHCWERPATRRWADLVNALAFMALLTTFTLVNLLPRLASGLHTYAR